jgi:hypothetical protein
MYVKINGEMHDLWRAVDQEGEVLESYVTTTRDTATALAFMKKALKRHGTPEVMTQRWGHPQMTPLCQGMTWRQDRMHWPFSMGKAANR